jgi:8-oxo-dGTP diphosphatase
MNKIRIVVALIEHNDRVLITQLSSTGSWELPGGIVKSKEDEQKVIKREIYNKMNISVKCDYEMCRKTYYESGKEIELVMYHCSYLAGEVQLHNYSNHIYVDKSILYKYQFSPMDIPLINYITGNV